jgi:hypothetical protein
MSDERPAGMRATGFIPVLFSWNTTGINPAAHCASSVRAMGQSSGPRHPQYRAGLGASE